MSLETDIKKARRHMDSAFEKIPSGDSAEAEYANVASQWLELERERRQRLRDEGQHVPRII